MGSRVLQDDVGDDVAGVATAVDNLFEQLVEVFQGEDLGGVMLAAEQILEDFEDETVGLGLDLLELAVDFLGLIELALADVAQELDQLHHALRGGVEEGDMPREVHVLDDGGGDDDALGDLLDRLGNLVEAGALNFSI